MRKIKLVFLLLAFIQVVTAQDGQKSALTWNTLLEDIKVRCVYSTKYGGLISKPKFGEEVMAMDGQFVNLRGFFLPADLTGKVFILSYNPSNMCFFCSGAGIESIVEINPSKGQVWRFKRLTIDNYFEVRGRLRLNADDYEHLIYILDEAEFIELIKD